MSDIPDNVDLNWIARNLVALGDEVRDLKRGIRAIYDGLGAMVMQERDRAEMREIVRSIGEQIAEMEAKVKKIERIEKNRGD